MYDNVYTRIYIIYTCTLCIRPGPVNMLHLLHWEWEGRNCAAIESMSQVSVKGGKGGRGSGKGVLDIEMKRIGSNKCLLKCTFSSLI